MQISVTVLIIISTVVISVLVVLTVFTILGWTRNNNITIQQNVISENVTSITQASGAVPINIAIINLGPDTNSAIIANMNAIQKQIIQHFEPLWNRTANLQFFTGSNPTIPIGWWSLVVAANSNVSGALGYHEVNANGLPLGYAFVDNYCECWSSSFSGNVS